MAKPRVFISSTYYDLKYVRERLERFIRSYNCEPILFESDKVYFHPNQAIDKSCYDEVKTCHLMILIIGGRYGSTATEQDKEQYENNTVSITQKEFETAMSIGIPVLTFIDMNVYADYETFINNSVLPENFAFAHVDDVKIFSFIRMVNQSAIKTFNRIEDIEQYFSNQISGMLYDYLVGLQKQKENEVIQNSVEQLNSVSNNMQNMLNSIAEKILSGNDKAKYEELLLKQKQSSIDLFIKMMGQICDIQTVNGYPIENAESDATIMCNELINEIFNRNFINEYQQEKGLKAQLTYLQQKEESISLNIQILVPQTTRVKFYFIRYVDQLIKILDIVEENETLKNYFRNKLHEMLNSELGLPF